MLFIPPNCTLKYYGPANTAAIQLKKNATLTGGGSITSGNSTDKTLIGIKVTDSYVTVDIGEISNFGYGIFLFGNDETDINNETDGTGYCYIKAKYIYAQYGIYLYIPSDQTGAWINENYIHVNRIQGTEGTPSPNYGIYIEGNNTHPINSNKFSGTIEGHETGVRLEGQYNTFYGLRMERSPIRFDIHKGSKYDTKNNWWYSPFGCPDCHDEDNWSIRIDPAIEDSCITLFGYGVESIDAGYSEHNHSVVCPCEKSKIDTLNTWLPYQANNVESISHQGDVSVGTTDSNPYDSYKLYVNGGIKGFGGETSISGFKNIFGRTNDGILHLRGGTSNGSVFINYYETGNVSIAKGGGKVAIGKVSANHTLDVEGTVNASGGYFLNQTDLDDRYQLKSSAQANLNLMSKLNNLSCIATSTDKSLKSIDESIEYTIPISELKQEFPNLVKQDSIGQDRYVNYVGLIPILVHEINNQREIIDSINGELTKLKSGILQQNMVFPENSNKSILYGNNPNPFSRNTTISAYIPSNIEAATIYIYDLAGTQIDKLIITDRGNVSVVIDGYSLKPGVYLYSLITDNILINTKQMILTD